MRKYNTLKQDLFVKYFMDANNKQTFLNAYQAAIKAGYSINTARDITSRALSGNFRVIKQKLEQCFNTIKKSDELTPQYVLNKLQQILQLFDDPAKMKQYYAKTSDIVRTLELLGKYLKLFTERVEVDGQVTINILPPEKQPTNKTD